MTKLVSGFQEEIGRMFDEAALPSLSQFIRIRNLSPAFDPGEQSLPSTHAALQHIATWAADHCPDGTAINTLDTVAKAPMLVIDIPGTADGTVLCCGHIDKQPSGEVWSYGASGYEPIVRDGKLYGRGSVDGGFAPHCYITAIATLAKLDIPRPRCVLFLETTEKSASAFLPRYLSELSEIVGEPNLIVFLESICADYERIWYLTGYRGIIEGHLSVDAAAKSAHSGAAGMAPSALGIAFTLLDRLADLSTGMMHLDALSVKVPPHLTTGGAETDAIAGRYFLDSASITGDVPGITDMPAAAALRPVWHAGLAVADINGLASADIVGGVLPGGVTLKIGVRVPPGCDAVASAETVEHALVEDPPHNAKVDFTPSNILPSWHGGALSERLRKSVDAASKEYFGEPATGWSIGGAYPSVEIIAQQFEDAPMLVTGLMGPKANFQDSDESLDLAAARKMIASIGQIFADLGAGRD
ncbi:M20/M25/M40 family metallo-hydrolase [Parasphingopyxis sp.]|uniref:M20/M25/M40 family metallo-hydrolase n=1 Tax=Parasphingopyxis sp. TaxID=1920299 RepID=UPI002631E63E|nr:M20/M25/M40 family metallo-hydrolase [Parasphingopyxis sp.]